MRGCVLLAALALGCSRQAEPPAEAPAAPEKTAPAEAAETDDAFRARAQAAVGRLKTGLMGALQAAMAEGGAVGAVGVCNVEASGIAAKAGQGLDVGRVSHKARNPTNRVEPWMRAALAGFEGTTAEKPAEPVVVKRPSGERAYFEPIYTGGVCITCHGSAVPEPVAQKIAALYPEDRAMGFEVGELRGAFRVWE